jgi:pyruvate formate lyase activating enzyme
MKAVCPICPHACALEEGRIGLCRARKNQNGTVVSINYGKITSIGLDPIEKKPLARFMPGSKILSVGSFGCNLSCPFCQNYTIACADENISVQMISPEELLNMAVRMIPEGNIGLAYTYNEPLIGYEYVMDCARLIRQKNLKNIVVSNGYINPKPLEALLPFIDAMNIDLKGFSQEFYNKLGGRLEPVKETIESAAKACHVEVTTLIIPGENDSEKEMKALSGFLAGLSPDIPLHISRFFPKHLYADRNPTPVTTVYRLAEVARESLNFVYSGNC